MRERRSLATSSSTRVKPKHVPPHELEEVREADPDGRPVLHHRVVDTLGKMLKSGTISLEMHDAARDFRAAFIVANLDPLRALPILRVPGTGHKPELNERQLDARRRVHEALQALGGISSPAGSCVWQCHRLRLLHPAVGDSAGLEWAAGAPGAGAGHPDRGVGDAGVIRRPVERPTAFATDDQSSGTSKSGTSFIRGSLKDLGAQRGGCDKERSG
jgi:hypothetical protein